MRKLTIVLHDAGGGHRAAANALKQVFQAGSSSPWDVTFLNLQEVLSSLDLLNKFAGIRIEESYNSILRRGWTRLTPQLLKVLQKTIRFYHSRIVTALSRYWLTNPSDAVLSVIPHFNRALAESIKLCLPGSPFITLITDLADFPPHFWIERESQYIITGTEKAAQQASDLSHPPHRIFAISGMVLNPKFYHPVCVDRATERQRLGLHPNRPTGIVLFGGHGSRVMVDIAKRLESSDVQLIMLCGHNEELASKLKGLRPQNGLAVQGFTQDVGKYMALGEFFIGKPGPASISEALQCRLPVIIECNSKTLPQERYNAEWVVENNFGIVVKSFDDIESAVAKLLTRDTSHGFQHSVSKYSNRALYEVPEILECCWRRSRYGENRSEELFPGQNPAASNTRDQEYDGQQLSR